jgi:glycosyltransferase involved in cell wall biosynthesis
MRLIILTQYFPPEVGAPQNRLYEIAVRLKQKGVDIEVLTAMPNYPQMEIHAAYKGKWYVKENMDGMTVHRSWIWVSKGKGMFSRLMNYFSFVFTSMWIGCFKLKKADYLLCESPPLFLGLSALVLKRAKHAKMIFNVADLWPEMAEQLGLITNRFLLNITKRLEEHLYSKSALITSTTKAFIKDIQNRFPSKSYYWLPNGVDIGFYDEQNISATWREKSGFGKDDFIVLYAGIIGHAQGLELVLKAAKNTNAHPIKWILLGSGPEKEKLLKMREGMKLTNVVFLDPVLKAEMPGIWKSVDVSLVPLKRIDVFKGTIPSKVFESMAMKKPLLLGVEGEAKELFIDEGKAGLAFIPEDSVDLANKALYLYQNKDEAAKFGENGRNYVNAKFNRNTIAQDFYALLSEMNNGTNK